MISRPEFVIETPTSISTNENSNDYVEQFKQNEDNSVETKQETSQENNQDEPNLKPIELNALFESYEEFLSSFNQYKKRTNQVYSITNSTMKTKTVPISVLFKCKYSKCVEKCKSKGNGIRPLQQYSAKNCPAHIRLTNIMRKGEYTDQFKITKFEPHHNHDLDPNTFRFDPQNRIMDKKDQAIANELLDVLKAAPRDVAKYMSERTNKVVLPSDLNNIKQRFR